MDQHPSAPADAATPPRAGRAWAITVGLSVIAAASLGVVPHAVHPYLPGRFGLIGFLVLVGLFTATEVFSVHLHFARNSHSFSLFEIPLTIGLFFAPGPALILAHVLGSSAALVLHRRQPMVKLAFNVASFVIADQLAIGVFRAVSGRSGAFTVTATFGAAAGTLVASSASTVMVIAVISVAEGHWDRRLISSLGFGSVSAPISTSLGLISVEMLTAHPESSWLLLVPTVGLYLANHAYTRERRRHHGLEFLHDSTRLLHQSPELETALVQLVGHARDAFRASFAELVHLPADSEQIVDVIAEPVEVTTARRPLARSELELLMGYVAGSTTPLLVQRGHSPAGLIAYLDAHDLSDAVIAPLHGDRRVCGLLVIGNRHGDVTRFDRDDLVLLATLAANIAAALENGRLEQSLDQLRQLERKLTHQATHDGLTELANRNLFTQQVTAALALAVDTGARVAVLFIDLDDFKTVNDSLGHAAGDELLIVFGRRLHAAVPETATAARLGGDEFAVVLPSVADVAQVIAIADRLAAAVGSPMSVMGRLVPVRASIGIAISTPGLAAAEMLRNADTAMYAAKGRGKNCVAVFESSLHDAAVHRYNLTFELERAIRDEEFVVHYQPIVRLVDSAVVGAEALVRWQHPTLGLLSPAAFIAIAEESGAIVHIGRAVLDQVCRFLAANCFVGSDGTPLYVSVNLSARDLLEPTLASHIATVLERHGIDPALVVFEVTEGLMISDPVAAANSLTLLKSLGVRIALDDFGTGYSSLSQLSRLPVDILKIAQPFIDDIHHADGATFVEAIIRLGQTLGLTLVAEGIEHPEQADRLNALGCELGQGYHYSRPIPQAAFGEQFAHQVTQPH